MAEPESTIPKPTPAERPRVSIALSEENLAALLGTGRERAEPPPQWPASVAVAAPAAELPATLALLSQVQEKSVPEPKPKVPTTTPEVAGETLAMIAAIRENRAELLRAKPAVKAAPAPQPVKAAVVPVPAAPASPAFGPAAISSPAPPPPSYAYSQGTVFPANGVAAASIPAWAAQPASAKPSGLAAAIEKLPGGRKGLVILGVAIAMGGVSAGLVLQNRRTAAPAQAVSAGMTAAATAAAPGNSFPLRLQAESLGNGSIALRWNAQSPLIDQARAGRLVVTEANQKAQTIAVPLEQLKTGRMPYQPHSEHVEFRLEVVDPSGFVAEESTVISGTAAPVKTESQNAVRAAAAQIPAEAPASVPETPAPSSPARQASRAFTAPSAQPVQERAMVEAPPALPNVVGNPLGTAGTPAAMAPALPPPAGQRQLQVANSLQAANLLKRVAPVYPALAKATHVEGAVRFQAVIGTDGAIRNLEVLSGAPLLRQAAIDAVRQWVYRPTLLNGQPQEVVTQIEVTFTLGR